MAHIEIRHVQEQVERFISDTEDARLRSEIARDYFDGIQWTAEEEEKLKLRGQAAIVVNRIRPKVKGLVGLYNIRNADPKAFPRTKKHANSAHAVTDALRFVTENNDFTQTRLDVAEEFFIEGYGGAVVVGKQTKDGVEIEVMRIPWDRIYFDPHSRNKDYSDSRFMGFYQWMYREEAEEKFPDADIEKLVASSDHFTDETTEDRPRWVDAQRDRVRIAIHFFIHKSVWQHCIFSDDMWLVEPQDSPFLDDDGEPTNPIELVSANINRLNERYGEVLGFIDQQDEMNHRRSKALHLSSSRQTFGRRGSVADVKQLKRELTKPDGHVEFDGDTFGKDFGILPTADMFQGQIEFYQDAKSELDSVSFNAQLAGDRQSGDLSGVAIDKLQSAGTTEVNQDYALLGGWELRIYRQIWSRVKQYWDEEKWIRITDDQDNLRWVGFNTDMSARDLMLEKIEDESIPVPQRNLLAQRLDELTQLENQTENPELALEASQQLEQTVSVSNPVAELAVDIILDQSFDVVNIEQEQFTMLTQFAQGSDIDIIELIELSQLRGKDELIEKIEKRRAEADQQNEVAINAQTEALEVKNAKTMADIENTQTNSLKTIEETKKVEADTIQTQVETVIIANNPDPKPDIHT